MLHFFKSVFYYNQIYVANVLRECFISLKKENGYRFKQIIRIFIGKI